MSFKPTPEQQKVYDWVETGSGNIVVTARAGSGKAQPLYAKVLTPAGFVEMGSIKAGDMVVSPKGGTATVKGVYPQGKKDVYRVHFRDGFYTDCCIDHLWNVKTSGQTKYKTLPLKSIIDDLRTKSGNMKYQIPLSPAVWNNQYELPTNPYLMGYYIGNGSLSSSPAISCHVSDAEEIIQKLSSVLPNGCIMGGYRHTSVNGVQFIISSTMIDRVNKNSNPLTKIITDLSLKVCKKIPDIYMLSSIEDRMLLLQGLMDSDGSCSKNRTSFSTKSNILADQMVELVQSLGGVAIKRVYDRTSRNKGIEYEINVKMNECPFSLERKVRNWSPSWKNPPSRYISRVEVLSPVEQQCISLDSEDGLYFTDNYIVTHNTTTIVEASQRMNGSIFLGAFNTKMANELKARTRNMPNTEASTFHSFGFRQIRNALEGLARVEVKSNKVGDLIKAHIESTNSPYLWKALPTISAIVSMAKQEGFGVDGITRPLDQLDDRRWEGMIKHYGLDYQLPSYVELPEAIDLAKKILNQSNENPVEIDYDDMIYLPLMYDMPMQQFDWVIIDEAQDTNNVRREMARRMMKDSSRFVAVADNFQAIYGFSGASHDSLDRIKRDMLAEELTLSVSFRCPKKVIEMAQEYVSDIKPFEHSKEGSVEEMPYEEMLRQVEPGDAIICRVNKHLVSTFFSLVRSGKAAKIEGRSIGKNLSTLASRWKIKDLSELPAKLETFRKREVEKAELEENTARVELIEDQVSTLLILLERAKADRITTITRFKEMIDNMFADDVSDGKGIITLTTVHRAKGLEWDNVFLLYRRDLMPSKFARKQWEKDQENNLIYVAITRAKNRFVDVY